MKLLVGTACGLVAAVLGTSRVSGGQLQQQLQKIDVTRGIVLLLDLPADDVQEAIDLARTSELVLFVQSPDADRVVRVRQAAEAAGLLGVRVFVDEGSPTSIHLAEDIADGIILPSQAAEQASDQELLRVLRPQAAALVGQRTLVKPVPDGVDEWTHPYHGPDNNPQSTDRLARGRLQTQFLGYPMFSPMPEQSVVAGGRIYKAMGHIAHKANQNEMLNTLLCINAYNGTILWKRPLPPGFMIHRNTMVATQDALYMGDHESCKVIDGRTGQIRDQITIPDEISDGPVWKWMAMRDGTLYALVGNPEIQVDTLRSERRGIGGWPWGMWKGHDYKDPRTAFGFGRTIVAIDVATKKVLWHYRDEEFLDARAVCMHGDRIFCYSPGLFLACIDAGDGNLLWKNSDRDLLEAIGPNGPAQHYITGYATTCYMKCNDQYVFFAGPQRNQLVVASAADGHLVWTHPHGNLQLVLREDGIYAAGPEATGVRLDYATGRTLATLPTRRACTRATGCADSIFYRAAEGTVRVMTASSTAQHIAPMRPPCQEGVLIANGRLYWGPWMCGCQLSLYGNICLAPAGASDEPGGGVYEGALRTYDRIEQVEPLAIDAADWPSYLGDNARSAATRAQIPARVKHAWTAETTSHELPTAPVVAGGLVFIADRTGVVGALDEEGHLVWKAYTAGPVYYPPAVAHDRLYVGSADGRVYAFEARTGRHLWTFRVAPEERWIPVYGKLISTWPVSGGVVVEDDTVYAAAGIAHYDGTYVVALDAITGQLKAANTTSGTLSPGVNSGISLQGELMISDGELRFLGGGVYETARYDLKTLECLNTPRAEIGSRFRTAFYPYYPSYNKYVSLDHRCADGATLCFDASYEGTVFDNLRLEAPLPPGVQRPTKEAARFSRRRGDPGLPPHRWQDKADRRFTSFVVARDQLLATGHPDGRPDDAFLVAINIQDGSDVWRESLPALAVKGGTAIDHRGRIYVALENGQLLCFAPQG